MAKYRYTLRMMRDLVQFARHNKAYWIVPLVLVLGLAGALVVATHAAAPFIYTLF